MPFYSLGHLRPRGKSPPRNSHTGKTASSEQEAPPWTHTTGSALPNPPGGLPTPLNEVCIAQQGDLTLGDNLLIHKETLSHF